MAVRELLDSDLLASMEHLTEEERQSILAVMKRAENLDNQANMRSRQLKEEYEQTKHKVLERRASIDRDNVCPLCGITSISDNPCATHLSNLCTDCEQISCSKCGSFQLNSKTKFQVWICDICSKRRKVVLSNEIQNIQHKTKGNTLVKAKSFDHSSDSAHSYAHKTFDKESTDSLNTRRNFLEISDDDYFQQSEPELTPGLSSPTREKRAKTSNTRRNSEPIGLSDFDQSERNKRSPGSKQQNFLEVEVQHHKLPVERERPENHPMYQPQQNDNMEHRLLYNSGATDRRLESGATDRHFESGATDRRFESGATDRRFESSATDRRFESSATDRRFESDATDRRFESDATDRRFESDATDRRFESGATDRRFESGETDRRFESGSTTTGSYSHTENRARPVDYYLSEEEELALIVQNRHTHNSHENMSDYESPVEQRSYPQHEWSPPMSDLSPIMDVSAHVELAAEAEWLAEQSDGNESERLLPSARLSKQQPSERLLRPIKPPVAPKPKISRPKESKPLSKLDRDNYKPPIAPKPSTWRPQVDVMQSHHVESFKNIRGHDDIAAYTSNTLYHDAESHTGSRPHILVEQISEEMDRDKDSQSTLESGYESQSRDLPGSDSGDVRKMISGYENRSMELKDEVSSGGWSEEKADLDDGMHYQDGVPIVAEGTTYNIHGGRDMFAKRSPRKNQHHYRQTSTERETSQNPSMTRSAEKAVRPQQIFLENGSPEPKNSRSDRVWRKTTPKQSPLSQHGTPTHTSHITGKPLKDRLVQVSPADMHQPSNSPPGVHASKPVPAPRRNLDVNSIIKPTALACDQLDCDEIVEIRFDGVSTRPMLSRSLPASNATNNQLTLISGLTQPASSIDSKEADIQRSMDELRRKEHDEQQLTNDLEKQLAEIRRMEERQRNILQNTLRQVVHSVHETQKPTAPNTAASALANTRSDELILESQIDSTSLQSPSFNRKTPMSSPMLNQRAAGPPSSPSKGRRYDMTTINENGTYNASEIASMSPATSHRALSNIAVGPIPGGTSPRLHIDPNRKYQSLPPRSERMAQQAYQDFLNSNHPTDPYSDPSFRLSSSFTDLFPVKREADKSGYFSDREADRRRIGDVDLRGYTDEARRAFLQYEIEKRRQQVDENNQLRQELQRLIQSGTIPASQYERLRDMYRQHINRSREFLRLSNTSLSSVATSHRTYDDKNYFTDSDTYMSSTEHLPGAISQSSTAEQIMQNNDAILRKKQGVAENSAPSTVTPNSFRFDNRTESTASSSTISTEKNSITLASSSSTISAGASENRKVAAMPLLDIKTPRTSVTSPGTTEMVKVGAGDIYRASSDASFGDPEEKIIDAKLEGGKAIIKSSQKNEPSKALPTANMPSNRFNFPTKQILITPDTASRGHGLGLHIQGGQLLNSQTTGALVSKIEAGTVAAQLLGEVKIGDEIVEWNGISLRNRSDEHVQTIISQYSDVIELTVKLEGQPYRLQRQSSTRSVRKSGSQYTSTESVTGGFESPHSDKSWTKEFDDSRQSTMKRGKSNTMSPKSPHSSEPNELFPTLNQTPKPQELQIELERKLSDMSEQLDRMNREPDSPQMNEISERLDTSWNRQSSTGSHTDYPDTDHEYRKQDNQTQLHRKQQPVSQSPLTRNHSEREKSLSPGRSSRSASDAGVHDTSTNHHANPERRGSHLDRIKNPPPPVSPRTGRHPNMPKLKDCGEIEAMLMYDYKRGVLVIRVERAAGLALPGKDNLNPFIKIHFIKNNTITEKRCTRFIEGTPNPKWEQSFTFTVEEPELCNYKIKMSAWDYYQPKQNMFIGTAVVDFSVDKHIDGNLRMYKLDSELIEQRPESKSGTPVMSRNTPKSRSPQKSSNASSYHQSTPSPLLTDRRNSNRSQTNPNISNSSSHQSIRSQRSSIKTHHSNASDGNHNAVNSNGQAGSPIEHNNNGIKPGQQKDLMRQRFIQKLQQ